MAASEVACCKCNQPADRTLGAQAFCTACAEAILGPIRERVADRDPFGGHGRQDGPMRLDYGPGWADLRCDRCGATWLGKIAEACAWCDASLALLVEIQRDVVLHPDLPDPDAADRDIAVKAWAERLGRAVAAGIVARDVAERALDKELAKSSNGQPS